jgi:hypothetical protein
MHKITKSLNYTRTQLHTHTPTQMYARPCARAHARASHTRVRRHADTHRFAYTRLQRLKMFYTFYICTANAAASPHPTRADAFTMINGV